VSKNDEKYAAITSTILALIEKGGLLPWQKPWKVEGVAKSISTTKPYRGINQWILSMTADLAGWSPWFGTYRQIEALGGQVRKGEKSTMVVLWKPLTQTDLLGNEKTFWMLKTFNVFSASQADGLPEKYYAVPESTHEVHQDAQEVFDGYVARESIPVTYGGSSASYAPRTDSISLPHPEAFTASDLFYATAFHEAAHSTGHASRLARPGVTDFDLFGSHQYGREELVAELTSAMLLGTLGLDKPVVVEHQASYLASWIRTIKEDPQALVWAAGRADKAADLILGISEAETPQEEAA
jgi:antirestriction protein ArdC